MEINIEERNWRRKGSGAEGKGSGGGRGAEGKGEMKRRERNGSSDVVFEKILVQYKKKQQQQLNTMSHVHIKMINLLQKHTNVYSIMTWKRLMNQRFAVHLQQSFRHPQSYYLTDDRTQNSSL